MTLQLITDLKVAKQLKKRNKKYIDLENFVEKFYNPVSKRSKLRKFWERLNLFYYYTNSKKIIQYNFETDIKVDENLLKEMGFKFRKKINKFDFRFTTYKCQLRK